MSNNPTCPLCGQPVRGPSDDVLMTMPCETDIWIRLEELARAQGGSFTIWPGFPMADGTFSAWTIRYEREPAGGRRRGKMHPRTFGEGDTRIAALMDLALQILPIEPRHG